MAPFSTTPQPSSRNRAERRHPEHRPPLRIPAAAEYSGLTERHLRRLVHERRLASYRVGGVVLIDPDDLDRLLDAGRREALR